MRWRVMYGVENVVTMFDDGAHGDGAAGDKIYAATIPASASTPGQMVRWRITAEDSTGDISKSPPFQDVNNSPEYWGTVVSVPNVVSGGQLPVLHWFTTNTSGADTVGGSRGAIFFNGQFLDNVLTDLHGQSSTGFPKKSYDFDLNTGHKLEWDSNPLNETPRINSFNLLTTYPDKSNIRNMLAYDVFERTGAAGHFVLPVQVRRNNAFFSVAHIVEDGDEDFLQRETTLDDQGALYKMYNSFESAAGGEKKSRKWEGNQDLTDFIAGLGQTGVTRERFVYDNTGVPETINFLASHIMTGNDDCCHKNYYVYRDTEGNREWRPVPWDLDLSFGRVWRADTTYYGDTMVANTSLYVGNGNRFMQLFNNNTVPALRQMFLRRLRTLADTVLNPTSMPEAERYFESRIDTFKALVKPEADYERSTLLWPTWGISQDMDTAINIMRNEYLPARRAYVFSQPELPAAQSPSVVVTFGTVEFDPASHNQDEEYFTLTNANAEAVDVSGWRIERAVDHVLKPGTVIPSGGTLYLSPNVNAFRARTTGPSGNQGLFVQGNYNGQLSARGETLTLMDGLRVVATTTYTGDPTAAQASLRITEIMYHPPVMAGDTALPDEYEFIELRNTGATPIDLTNVHFNNGITFSFTTGSLAPGAFAVLVRNPIAFAQRYPAVTPAGTFVGGLNNAEDRIILLDGDNEEIHDFTFLDTWHPLTDGQGFSLQVVDQGATTGAWGLATQWRPSGKLGGTPGAGDALGDADSDGMPDLWEVQNGLNPNDPTDAAPDLDQDGQSNLSEYLAGTDPNRPQSVFAATAGGFSVGGAYQGSFSAVAGKTYTVQYSEDLQPSSWHKVSDHSPTADGVIPFSDAGAASSNRRFYRVVTPTQP
jgi:CotH kinase protein/Lamin Tail Domain